MAISAFLGFWTGESAVLVLPLLLVAISVPWDNRLSFHKKGGHSILVLCHTQLSKTQSENQALSTA